MDGYETVDLWNPNEQDGEIEPMIQNGPLAISKISLSSALKVIRETAFERTRYPLILRLSVHCNFDWQKVAAKLILTHLGTKKALLSNYILKLYLPTADPTDWNNEKNHASPWDFQMRILIMASDGKKLNSSEESGDVTEDEDGMPSSSRRKGRRCDLVPPFLQIKTLYDLMSTAPNSSTSIMTIMVLCRFLKYWNVICRPGLFSHFSELCNYVPRLRFYTSGFFRVNNFLDPEVLMQRNYVLQCRAIQLILLWWLKYLGYQEIVRKKGLKQCEMIVSCKIVK
uniref:PLCXc domain-containing protein n=1 Tax=Heterorhabditis bacteriophora TaxID=37862 RepID=A0A1I7WYX6_HETBA